MSVEIIRSLALAAVPHGFLGRGDDVSQAIVAAGRALVTVHQVHSAQVVRTNAPFADAARPRADAMVSDQPGLVLGIVTADCAPVLLADVEAGVIGAAHAGWKGAAGGVIEATVDAMERLGARRGAIAAAIGPCIAQASYEVDAALRDKFDAADHGCFATGRKGHWQFDLEGLVVGRLRQAGVERIDALGRDTYADPGFFSFRRATHAGEAHYGRQFSLIALPDAQR